MEWPFSGAAQDRWPSDDTQRWRGSRAAKGSAVLTTRIIAEEWQNRDAVRLTNGTMDAVLLRGGGHVAELRLAKPAGAATNCLWPAPWQTADPGSADFDRLANEYGGAPAGNFLAGYTGHALCLDVFGAPSDEEAARGVPLHGEAAARMWSFDTADNRCTARVDLPAAQLEFERITSLAEETAVLFFHERVHNLGSAAREIHWVQHLSLGPPFLAPGQSAIDASLDRARTWPLGYEGHAVLRDDANFGWPLAPALDDSRLDLRIPFARSGYGFVAAARVDLTREFAFISALNWQLGLALVYCFRRADFPWIAIWEESRARPSAPWNGAAQVRGMEFGTTPMPVGRDAIRAMGNLFDTPGSRVIAAGETLEARYLAAIAHVPSEWRAITHVVPDRDALVLTGPGNSEPVILAANGLQNFLQEGHGER